MLDHVAFRVNDIEEALAWYRRQLDVLHITQDESRALLAFENVRLLLVTAGPAGGAAA